MKHCVITGAADGIGKALAFRYLRAGYAVVGIDIDQERARQVEAEAGGAPLRFVLADLGTTEGVQRALERLQAGPTIDLLIHNAGINQVGRFADLDPGRQLKVLDVNLLAPMQITAGLLGAGKLVAGSSLVFIASMSHFLSYPGAAVYAASKDGLTSYARSLRVALATKQIRVLTVFPGPTRTAHARRWSPDNRNERRRMLPETLAEAIFQAQQAGRSNLIPGWNNRIVAYVGRWMPRVGEWMMERAVLRKLDKNPLGDQDSLGNSK